jgi:hypothetical protein
MKTHTIKIFEPEDAIDCNNTPCNLCCFYIEDPENCLQVILSRQEY